MIDIYSLETYDETDLAPIEYSDCGECGQSYRGPACRRCGKLARVLARVEHMQLTARLHLSLLRQGGSLDHQDAATWLGRWTVIWLSAAFRIERAS